MKKYLLFVLLFILSSNLFSQHVVQNEFFGYFFGENKEIIKNDLNRNNIYFSEDEENLLSLNNRRFAGYKWDFVNLEFYNKKFYSIDFSIPFNRKSGALDLYNILKNKLDEKYKSISQFEKNEEYSKGKIFYDDYNSCLITIRYNESKGGEMYWYVGINYWNNYLNDEFVNSNNDEL